MSTLKKLKNKFYEKPVRNDLTIDEVVRLAESYGCIIMTGGNHQIRIVHKPTGTVIPLPSHGKTVKETYIVELKNLFIEIEKMRGEEQ